MSSFFYIITAFKNCLDFFFNKKDYIKFFCSLGTFYEEIIWQLFDFVGMNIKNLDGTIVSNERQLIKRIIVHLENGQLL